MHDLRTRIGGKVDLSDHGLAACRPSHRGGSLTDGLSLQHPESLHPATADVPTARGGMEVDLDPDDMVARPYFEACMQQCHVAKDYNFVSGPPVNTPHPVPHPSVCACPATGDQAGAREPAPAYGAGCEGYAHCGGAAQDRADTRAATERPGTRRHSDVAGGMRARAGPTRPQNDVLR